ncbi:MAG: S-layer homology domain-containing protein [Leptolyngbyaceae cyanobacterium]
MSNPFPQPPPPANRDDEWIAVVVALGALGTVLGWALIQSGWFQGAQGILQNRSAPVDEAIKELANDQLLRKTQLEPEGQANPVGLPLLSDLREADLTPQSLAVLSPPEADEVAMALQSVSPLPVSAPAQQQNLAVPEPLVPIAEAPVEPSVETARPPLAFSDVPSDHWAKRYIDALTGQRILAGFPDGTFGPDQAMTRAELAAQLVPTFELSSQADSPFAFADLPPEYWATDTIQTVVATGFMQGYPNARFQPDQTVPRVQVIATIAAGLQLQPTADSAAILARYQDSSEIPPWAEDAVAAVIATDLAKGETDQAALLRPNQPATRAEVATLLHQALVYLGKLPPVDSSNLPL